MKEKSTQSLHYSFINDNLNPLTEKKTKGHGGKRLGAGRPKGTLKEPKERISLPIDIASWFKSHPEAIELARKVIQRHHLSH